MDTATEIQPSGDGGTISSWLRGIMAERGLNQQRTAGLAGVSAMVIHHLVKGSGKRPHQGVIERLERAFGPIPASHRDDLRGGPFSRMTVDQLLDHCRGRYRDGGPEALLYRNLKRTKGLYSALYAAGLRQRVLMAKLGIDAATFKDATTASRDRTTAAGWKKQGWNRARIIELAKGVVEEQGHLPPAGWFRANGISGLVQAMYGLGMGWGDLLDALGLPPVVNGSLVRSRNGLWWRSNPEACLSNYLHALGVPHRVGDAYPKAYAAMSGRKYGQYDVTFLGRSGAWHNVEIWGDKPNGHDAEGYARTRLAKETFNAGDPNFIAMHFTDCWSVEKLDAILGDVVGTDSGGAPPGETDITGRKVRQRTEPNVHWAAADELIAFCRTLAEQQPDGQFPAEDWLRKRGKHASREGPAYNTLSCYIKIHIGGIRNLRKAIGQSHVSTVRWTKESAAAELIAWVSKYDMPPSITAELALRRGHVLDRETILHGQNLDAAIRKHFGRLSDAYRELGLTVTRTPRLKRRQQQTETNE